MSDKPPGRAALAHIDKVLAARPRRDDGALSQATACLAEFRDAMIGALRRTGGDAAQRTRLAHVNAVITVVLGIHFPLGEVPWDELANARAWLAELVADGEAVA